MDYGLILSLCMILGSVSAGAAGENKPWDVQPAPRAPGGDKPWEVQPAPRAPGGDKPWEVQLAPRAPGENKPWEVQPAPRAPGENNPWEIQPAPRAPGGDKPWEAPQVQNQPPSGAYTTVYSYGDPNNAGMGAVTVMERQSTGTMTAQQAAAASSAGLTNGGGVMTMVGGGQGGHQGLGPVLDRQGPGNTYGGASANYGIQPPSTYQTYGYKDPGFSVQTGFEGFLVPNPWYGLIPWGIEGVIIVVVGVIAVAVVVIAFIFLFVKIFSLGKLLKEDDGTGYEEDETTAAAVRSYVPSYMNKANLRALTTHFYDALDKYNDLIRIQDHES